MNGLFKSMLWSAVNGLGLVDELHLAAALGGGISADLFAQPKYFRLEHLRRVLAETDARNLKHNRVSLVDLIKINENHDGWVQKADVRVDKGVLAHFRDQLPSVLWIYFPLHDDTVNVEVF